MSPHGGVSFVQRSILLKIEAGNSENMNFIMSSHQLTLKIRCLFAKIIKKTCLKACTI